MKKNMYTGVCGEVVEDVVEDTVEERREEMVEEMVEEERANTATSRRVDTGVSVVSPSDGARHVLLPAERAGGNSIRRRFHHLCIKDEAQHGSANCLAPTQTASVRLADEGLQMRVGARATSGTLGHLHRPRLATVRGPEAQGEGHPTEGAPATQLWCPGAGSGHRGIGGQRSGPAVGATASGLAPTSSVRYSRRIHARDAEAGAIGPTRSILVGTGTGCVGADLAAASNTRPAHRRVWFGGLGSRAQLAPAFQGYRTGAVDPLRGCTYPGARGPGGDERRCHVVVDAFLLLITECLRFNRNSEH